MIDLETPALVVDIPAMHRNIARMTAVMAGRGISWRPHCKAHRLPEIARIEIAAGAIGVTCAKQIGRAHV